MESASTLIYLDPAFLISQLIEDNVNKADVLVDDGVEEVEYVTFLQLHSMNLINRRPNISAAHAKRS